ncbi:hypothetical protein B4168_2203 [Anoxybacillus flavithermus]|nr:hypothetical protein B4168_2203 [Anoxybacillus flavithermus]
MGNSGCGEADVFFLKKRYGSMHNEDGGSVFVHCPRSKLLPAM